MMQAGKEDKKRGARVEEVITKCQVCVVARIKFGTKMKTLNSVFTVPVK